MGRLLELKKEKEVDDVLMFLLEMEHASYKHREVMVLSIGGLLDKVSLPPEQQKQLIDVFERALQDSVVSVHDAAVKVKASVSF